jgi:hypothetical protein
VAGVISSDPHREAIAALLDAEHLAPEHVRFHHLMNTVAGSLTMISQRSVAGACLPS